MKKMMKHLLQAGSFGFLFSTTFQVLALGDPWTTIGSAGIADEADVYDVMFASGIANISPSAPASTTVVLRYNVTSTADLNDNGVNKVMSVRFRDNGNSARVRLYLRGYNLSNGALVSLLSFDSNNYSSSYGFQMRTVGDGCVGGSFDFDNYAYYIEAHLTRTDSSGLPALSIIKLNDNDIC